MLHLERSRSGSNSGQTWPLAHWNRGDAIPLSQSRLLEGEEYSSFSPGPFRPLNATRENPSPVRVPVFHFSNKFQQLTLRNSRLWRGRV